MATTGERALAIRPMLTALPTIPLVNIMLLQDMTVEGADTLKSEWEEAESDFREMALFGREEEGGSAPPCGIDGRLDGVRNIMVGQRNQMIYDLSLPDGRKVGVWGSAVLDNRMAKLNPDKGQRVVIVYTGETESAPKGNPARLFRVWKFKG